VDGIAELTQQRDSVELVRHNNLSSNSSDSASGLKLPAPRSRGGQTNPPTQNPNGTLRTVELLQNHYNWKVNNPTPTGLRTVSMS